MRWPLLVSLFICCRVLFYPAPSAIGVHINVVTVVGWTVNREVGIQILARVEILFDISAPHAPSISVGLLIIAEYVIESITYSAMISK